MVLLSVWVLKQSQRLRLSTSLYLLEAFLSLPLPQEVHLLLFLPLLMGLEAYRFASDFRVLCLLRCSESTMSRTPLPKAANLWLWTEAESNCVCKVSVLEALPFRLLLVCAKYVTRLAQDSLKSARTFATSIIYLGLDSQQFCWGSKAAQLQH